jgi:hypothetical protein
VPAATTPRNNPLQRKIFQEFHNYCVDAFWKFCDKAFRYPKHKPMKTDKQRFSILRLPMNRPPRQPSEPSPFRQRPKMIHSALLLAALLAGSFSTQAAEPADTVVKAGTLFIEAEDFNFGNGKSVTDQKIGMDGQYAGGAYQGLGTGVGGTLCDGSDFGVDYNEGNPSNEQSIYRPDTGVEAGKPNGPAGVRRAGFDVEVNHTVGWTAAGEWANYTRKFPEPAKIYKVYARMATDVGLIRGGELSRVTSDPTKCNQTTQVLGSFNAPSTGGWDTWPDSGGATDALVPLRDAAGADALVRLGGTNTVRYTWTSNQDLDYLAFVPQAIQDLPPKVLSLTPGAGVSGVVDKPLIEAVVEDGTVAKVASIRLVLDGNVVSTAGTRTGNTTKISFPVATALAPGSSHTLAVIHTDDSSPAVTRTNASTFRVSFVPLPAGTLFIESEDFNFGKGQWVTNKPIGMTGAYPGGDYAGLGNGLDGAACDGSDFGIDFNDNSSTDQAVYRPTTPVEAGKTNGPAGLSRGTFNVVANHVIGWTGDGEWMNYTRKFPDPVQGYLVYARMAHGDAAARRHAELSRVTNDPTKCDPVQTVEVLGTFDAPWTGGWDTWPDAGTPQDALIPLRNEAGQQTIVRLGGTNTIRFTFLPGAGDADFLAFVPIGEGPVITSLSPARSSGGGLATGSAEDVTKIEATLEDVVRKVVSATLQLDGKPITATTQKTGTTTKITATLPAPLTPGTAHTATLTYVTDSTPPTTNTVEWGFKLSVLHARSLFIEAEDFNFGKGQWIKTGPIGMTGAYPGGDYQDKGDGLDVAACAGSDHGIDYMDNLTTDQAIYRPGTPVEAGKLNVAAAGRYRGTFDVEVNHIVGWTGTAEWMNYTRVFPEPARVYKVYARMAHGDAAAGVTRGGELFRVTSDPTQCNQTVQSLGTFSGPWTGGWDTWPDAGTPQDALLPMRDAAGADALVKLGGTNTLRWGFRGSAGDLDYIVFVPTGAAGLPPKVLSLKPANGASGVHAQPVIEAMIEDGEVEQVTSASLTVDGVPATTATSTKVGKITTIRYTPPTPFVPGSSHTYQLSYTDNAPNPETRTSSGSFRVTFTPFVANTLFIEAEDFNFGKGQWVTNKPIGMTGAYPGGDYAGLGNGLGADACTGTDHGIDYMDNLTSDQAVYRPNTPVEAGKTNGPAGLNRGSFDVVANHAIGWTGGSEWMNYTRRFPEPAQRYKVYARMARDEAASTRGGVLFKVTSDPTVCDQTTEELGTFRAPWTGGWDTWPDAGTPNDALIPMKDAAGNVATITLGGLQTLRWQFQADAGDLDYLAFVPQAPTGPQITSIRRNANGSITLEWTGGGILETTPVLPATTWIPITGATSPFTFTPQAGVNILYGRIRVPAQ